MFSHIHNVRHIKVNLPTFGYILADSGNPGIVRHIHVY